MSSTRLVELVIDTVVCLTLAKWETVSGQFGGYLIDWRKYAALTSLQTGTALGHSCFQVSRESWTSPAGEPHGSGRSCPSRWFPMKALPPARSCCPACPESRRQSFGHWGRSFVPLQGRRSAPKQVALRLQAP